EKWRLRYLCDGLKVPRGVLQHHNSGFAVPGFGPKYRNRNGAKSHLPQKIFEHVCRDSRCHP
ncbi:hypothetical protein WAI56_20525, partial [Acinetobacter baumannii]